MSLDDFSERFWFGYVPAEPSPFLLPKLFLVFFPWCARHDGMCQMRMRQQQGNAAGEQTIGARAYRVLFASISLPLAVVAVVFFINHRYDGIPLWNLRQVPGTHEFVWLLNFISFFFLYPSTFNLLEVCFSDGPSLSQLHAIFLRSVHGVPTSWVAAPMDTSSRVPHKLHLVLCKGLLFKACLLLVQLLYVPSMT